MKITKKATAATFGAMALMLIGTNALAHPGGWGMGGAMGPGMMRGVGPCVAAAGADEATCPLAGGGGPRANAGRGCAAYGTGEPGAAAQPLMTPEERQAFFDKMRSATTPEERQKLMLENRAEMQKRAAERGITMGPGGWGMGYGGGPGMMGYGRGGGGPGMGPMRGYNAPQTTPR